MRAHDMASVGKGGEKRHMYHSALSALSRGGGGRRFLKGPSKRRKREAFLRVLKLSNRRERGEISCVPRQEKEYQIAAALRRNSRRREGRKERPTIIASASFRGKSQQEKKKEEESYKLSPLKKRGRGIESFLF